MVTLYAEGDLLISRDESIVTATFNRPQTRNALTFDMYERLSVLCKQAAHDQSLRAIILTGAGEKAFAAGTDISKFKAFKSGQDGIDYEKRMEAVLDPVEKCPVPLIAAIAGACTGGGAAIAACCDLRIATADMRFGFPIARSLGNTLALSNFRRLVALMGPARVKHLIFTARLMEAQEALSIGFTITISENCALPAARFEIVLLTPIEKEMTSISPAWPSTTESPGIALTPVKTRKNSSAARALLVKPQSATATVSVINNFFMGCAHLVNYRETLSNS